jgi:hypothetical protein
MDFSLSVTSAAFRVPMYHFWAIQAAEKPEFFEGDGLQAVHNCFVVNAALAAEGAIFHQPRLFPQPA